MNGTTDDHPEPDLIDYSHPSSRPALEQLGEATWSAALNYLYDQAFARPVGPDSYRELRRRFFGDSGTPGPAPDAGKPSDAVLTETVERVLPYAYNAHHPRSLSYFTTPPLPMSVAGDVLASWLHQSVDVFHASPIGALVEEEVTTWLRDLVGVGPQGWAVLTSGGVMANLLALTVIRDVRLAERLGLDRPPRGRELDGVRVYCSDQAHFSIGRGLDELGFPSDTLCVLPSDDGCRLRPADLSASVAADRSAGLLPLAVCAVSGTTNTGSVDPVPAIAEIAAIEDLWLHADAAYGGGALLSRRDAKRVPGLAAADSVTVDPHKWFFQPIDIGALVVKRREDLHRTFVRRPEYYRSGATQEHPLAWMEYGLEGTRRFRGLKLWMSWKHLGTVGLGRLVERTDDLADHLASLLRAAPDFQMAMDPPELSVVCFRHLPAGVTEPGDLDRHQDRLQHALETSGEGWVSTTRLRDSVWLRAGVVNHMSTEADLEAVIESLRTLAASLNEDHE